MRRTIIQLDDDTHAKLRRRAYEQGRSMASLVRETLTHALEGTRAGRRPAALGDYPFVAVGTSGPSGYAVSEGHDRALADAIQRAAKPAAGGRKKRR